MDNSESETDWERVLAFKKDAPIPFGLEDGPNDAGATRAWLVQADLIRRGRETRLSRLEAELLRASNSKDLLIAPEEPNGRALVSVLQEKLKTRYPLKKL